VPLGVTDQRHLLKGDGAIDSAWKATSRIAFGAATKTAGRKPRQWRKGPDAAWAIPSERGLSWREVRLHGKPGGVGRQTLHLQGRKRAEGLGVIQACRTSG